MASENTTNMIRLCERMAASGDYDAALSLLNRFNGEGVPSEAQTLYAKILSQQGNFARAVDAWQAVIDQAPDDTDAQRALELAKRLSERGARTPSPRGRLAIAGVLVLVIATGFCLAYTLGRNAGVAAAMAQESVRQAQTERLREASGLVDSLYATVASQKQEDATATAALETRLASLDQRVISLGEALDRAASGQERSAVQLVESLGSRLDESRDEARSDHAETEKRFVTVGEQLAQQLAQGKTNADQIRAADEQLTALENRGRDQGAALSAEFEAVRQDLAAALSLAKEVQTLRDTYELMAYRRGYISLNEHCRMRQELSRLCDQSDALLERVARHVLDRSTATRLVQHDGQ